MNMIPDYLLRPQQAPLARPSLKPRARGLPLSIWYPNGRMLALYQDGNTPPHEFYQVAVPPFLKGAA